MENSIFKRSVFWKMVAIFTLFFSLWPRSFHAALPEEQGKVLIVAQGQDWPPFAFKNKKGEAQGLLVDLWQAIGHEMGYEVRFHLTDWQASLDAVQSGRAQVHSGLIFSPKRAEIFDFSADLVPVQTFFFASSKSIPLSLASLNGREVGVVSGTYEMEFIRSNHPEVLLRPYRNNEEMILDALKGSVHTFVADYPATMYFLDLYGMQGAFHPVQYLYSKNLRAAFLNNNSYLKDEVNQALANLGEEKIRHLSQRWMRSEKIEVLPAWLLPALGGGVAVLFFFLLLFYNITLRRQRQRLMGEVEKKNVALQESEEQLKFFEDNTAAGIFILKERNFVAVNQGLTKILGYDEKDLLSLDISTFVHPDDRNMVMDRALSRQAGLDRPICYEIKLLTQDGDTRWVDAHAALMGYQGGQATHGTFFDITERKKNEKIQEQSLEFLRKVFTKIPCIIFQYCLNADGHSFFPYMSSYVFEIAGVTPDEVAQDASILFAAIHPEDTHSVIESIQYSATNMLPWQSQFRICHRTGKYHWWEGKATPEEGKDGTILWYGYFADIQEWRDAQDRITYMALHDTLTGLPNRTLFEDRVDLALAVGKRDQSVFALLFMDLDRFKPINDKLGHRIGDLVLQEVAQRIQDGIRASDTAARIGGDEFVVLLRGIQGRSETVKMAEKLRNALHQPYLHEGHTLRVSVSIGVAMYPDHGQDLITLTNYADKAMYQAKEEGGDRVYFYTD